MKLYDQNKNLFAIANLQDGIYTLRACRHVPVECAYQARTWEDWHQRFGHIGVKGLQRLQREGLVDGLTVVPSPIVDCPACIEAKQSRIPLLTTSEPRNTQPGEMIHTDVWEPAQTEVLSGRVHWYISFVDDATRYCEVRFMVSKREASNKLKEYLTYLERQLGRRTKAVRADNGKEYINNALLAWCRETGIDLQVTAPYSPAQNGVSERFNRTLGELARAMRIVNGVPPFLWPESIAHAAYVRNRSHTRAVDGATPFERWTGRRPDVSHLEAFGSAVWILKEGISINKLDAKSERHTFVGFVDGPRAILFYDARMRSIKTSCNFRFLNRPVSQPAQTDDSPRSTQREGESRTGDAPDTIDNENTKSIEWATNISNGNERLKTKLTLQGEAADPG